MDNNELQLCEINELNTSQMDFSDSNIIFVIDSCILPDEGRLELVGLEDLNCFEQIELSDDVYRIPIDNTADTPAIDDPTKNIGSPIKKDEKSKNQIKRRKPNSKNRTKTIRQNLLCDICNQHFSSRIALNRHKLNHTLEKPYKCFSCPESFNYHENLVLHSITHDESVKSCPTCGITFKRIVSLHGHIQTHFKSEVFTCNYCEEGFVNRHLLKLHLEKNHTIEWNNTRAPKLKIPIKKSKTTLQCKICAKIFFKQSHFIRHMRIHNGDRPFACSTCDKKFGQQATLKMHMRRHTGFKPYKCEECFLKFSQKGNLKIHIKRVHTSKNDDDIKYPCSQCSCVFHKLGTLNRHITEQHSKIRENREEDEPNVKAIMNQIALINKSSCAVMQEENEKRSTISLADHDAGGEIVHHNVEEVIQEGKRLLVCSFCCKHFTRPSDLLRHIRIHTKEKPYACYLCKRNFSLKKSLNVHLKTHDNEVNKFSCSYCQKNFKDIESLENHAEEHINSDPNTVHNIFQCFVCKVQFETGLELRTHSRLEHNSRKRYRNNLDAHKIKYDDINVKFADPLLRMGNDLVPAMNMKNCVPSGPTEDRPHVCQTCNLSFRKVSHLKQHELSHTGLRPHKCKYCEKSFKSANSLTLHVRAHLGQKPWRCTDCEMSFISKAILTRHLLTHSKERNFLCPYCPKTFKSAVSCRRHIKIHKTEIVTQSKGNINKSILQNLDNTSNLVLEKTEFFLVPPQINLDDIPKGEVINVMFLDATPTGDFTNGDYLVLNENFESAEFNIVPEQNYESQIIQSEMIEQLSPSVPQTSTTEETDNFSSNPHKCDHCPRSFKKPIDFRRHMLTHTGGKPYQCQTCQKSFRLSSTLRTHEKIHADIKETVTCHVCSNKYTSKSSLKIHMRIHTGDKPFACSYCSATFRTTGHKSAHEKVHVRNANCKGVDPKDIITKKSKFSFLNSMGCSNLTQ